MVRAWFMDDDTVSDQRLDHHKCPQEFIDVNELYKLSGVEYFKVTIDFDTTDLDNLNHLSSIFFKSFIFLSANHVLDLIASHKSEFLPQSITQLLHI